eukprot:TRINITY_DN3125_c0_g1_i3.p1 TRINITY_DN3125_c0_g1~~TRINITY_DN3125_c0_g1_i3.p1  ORF type:complete len:232 (-),score=49.52 TRINITY_DN3125_c0_g1_i3:768-1463(-)
MRPPVIPGKVSPTRLVPGHILRPPYVVDPSWRHVSDTHPFFILSTEQQDKMRAAGKLARRALNLAGSLVSPGRTTEEIDCCTHDFIINSGAYPSPLGYFQDSPDVRYPKSICTSVNEVLAHGIPDDRPLQEGDIVSIDVTVYLEGFHGDCCQTFFVGANISEEARELVEMSKKCVEVGISCCKPGAKIKSIGKRIQSFAFFSGYTVVDYLTGHGVGSEFHSPPWIHHTGIL